MREQKKASEGDRSLSSFQRDSKHSSTDSTAPFRKCNFSEILHLSSKDSRSATVKSRENEIWRSINLFKRLYL